MRYLPELPKLIHWLPFIILAPIKVVHQVIGILMYLLVWIDIPPEFILVQVRQAFLYINHRTSAYTM